MNGDLIRLTPEIAMEIQKVIGSDIQMVLDECTHYPATKEEASLSMKRSEKWALRSHESFLKQKGDDDLSLIHI